MGFKLGLIAGAAAGYVLGTKAGRERYEQLREASEAFRGSRTARSLEDGLRDVWGTAQEEFGDVAATTRFDRRGRPGRSPGGQSPR